jgi:hypothetical protein
MVDLLNDIKIRAARGFRRSELGGKTPLEFSMIVGHLRLELHLT